jgi:hypothetical protein
VDYGQITQIEKLSPTHDSYTYRFGFISIDNGSPIFWGGSHCPTATYGSGPTNYDLQILHQAQLAGQFLNMLYKVNGTRRCYSGFELR